MLTGKQVIGHFGQGTNVLVGFQEYLVQAMLAILTREHVLWIGPPGVGKSFAARVIFGLFTGAPQMRIQLTKDMMPNHLIGNEIPEEYLKTGREVYNLDGGITQAKLFFGDEFQDASDFLLRTLLSIMNERKFERKDMQVDCALHSAFLTTNFDRISKAIEAVNDRVIFKSRIPSLEGLVKEMEMYNRYLNYCGEVPGLVQIPFSEIEEVADFIESADGILIPRGVLLTASVLINKYDVTYRERAKEEKLNEPDPISPRTKNKMLDVLRASAFLHERNEVAYDDLKMLKYMLCVLGDQNLDERVFTEVHDEVFPKTRKVKDARDRMAGLVQAINDMKASPHSTLAEIIVHIGTQVKTYSKMEFEGLIQSLRKDAKGVDAEILTDIEKSFKAMNAKPEVLTFNWRK